MEKLIYFTLAHNPDYIKLAKICVESIYAHGYDGDLLFITDMEDGLMECTDFRKKPKFMRVSQGGLTESSANKLRVHLYPEIGRYDKIIFSDLDIIWTGNPDIIFDLVDADRFYVSNEESPMSDVWWGGDIFNAGEKDAILTKGVKGINAGIFAFNRNMVVHLSKIENFMKSNVHLINECLEQPFFNVFLHRNSIYETYLTPVVSHWGTQIDHRYEGVALHFPGGPGNFAHKYDRMTNYIYRYENNR